MRRFGICLSIGTLTGVALAHVPQVSLSQYADHIDVIGLSRGADALGDPAIRLGLEQPKNREEALVAVRTAAFGDEPEVFIPALKQIACGRDPVLAPEAAWSLSLIAEQLSDEALARREVLLEDLKKGLESLDQECETDPRPDIALTLSLMRARFAAKD